MGKVFFLIPDNLEFLQVCYKFVVDLLKILDCLTVFQWYSLIGFQQNLHTQQVETH